MLLRPGGPGGKNYLREEEGEKQKTKKEKKQKRKKEPHKTRKTLHLGLPHLIFFLN